MAVEVAAFGLAEAVLAFVVDSLGLVLDNAWVMVASILFVSCLSATGGRFIFLLLLYCISESEI